nr:hypothetical protein [Aeromicrobium sp.]
MTEKSEGPTPVPGSGAGDAAPTQAIPRIPKPDAKKPAAGGKVTAAKPAAAKPAPVKNAAGVPTETDKGRPRTPGAGSSPDKTIPAGTPRQVRPTGGPSGRPLTAADYSHTTKGSPASTSVIPVVKESVDDKRPAAAPANASVRRASLRLTHVEPWSVTRLAFAISVAMMIVAVVAVAIFWIVLDFAGVWDQINDSFTTVLSDDSASFNVTDYFGFGRVLGLTLVLSAVNVVLMTALATIAAHLYNLAAQLMGGIEVTLAEDNK